MNPHEQNYHAQEQELPAIVESLRHWRSYLHGQTFPVQTDHASLQYLTTQDHLTPHQVRWLESLIDFDFKIFHISGKINLVADALSRSPKDIPSRHNTNQAILLDALRRNTPHTSHHTKIHLISSLQLDPQNLENLKIEYMADPEFQEHFRNHRPPYSLRNGLLHFNEKVCVPIGNIRLSLFHYTHDIPSAGHPRVRKLLHDSPPRTTGNT
jgi:RNase H-like domain found in reverse transcriptase